MSAAIELSDGPQGRRNEADREIPRCERILSWSTAEIQQAFDRHAGLPSTVYNLISGCLAIGSAYTDMQAPFRVCHIVNAGNLAHPSTAGDTKGPQRHHAGSGRKGPIGDT